MAHRQFRIAILSATLVGVLLGAGVTQFASITADMLVARTDFVKRSQRSNEVFSDQGQQNPGTPDARNEGRTSDTRTEKGVTAAQIARGCANANDRAGCLEDAFKCAMDQICGE